VDELLISADLGHGRPLVGDADAALWESRAMQHKVSRVHYIAPDTKEGKYFCQSVGVGGLLSQRWANPLLETEDISPISCGSSSPRTCNIALEAGPPEPTFATSTATPSKPRQSVSGVQITVDDCLPPLSGESSFFMWLQRAICTEMAADQTTAMALLDGAHVILADATSDPSSLQEMIWNVRAILADDAPTTAEELEVRWRAAQIAETDVERAMVTMAHVSELPAAAFVCDEEAKTIIPFDMVGTCSDGQPVVSATAEMPHANTLPSNTEIPNAAVDVLPSECLLAATATAAAIAVSAVQLARSCSMPVELMLPTCCFFDFQQDSWV